MLKFVDCAQDLPYADKCVNTAVPFHDKAIRVPKFYNHKQLLLQYNIINILKLNCI